MNAHTTPPPADAAVRALGNIEDLVDAAHGELQIVDYLIEMGRDELAYRATSAVFDKLAKIRAAIARGKEAAQ